MEMMSQDISKLAEALSKAQGILKHANKDSQNSYLKNSYAALTSTWDACREALSANQLSIVQIIDVINEKNVLVSILMHASGQWIKSITPLIAKHWDAQGMGGAITYARRYALSALVGICPEIDEDDDGETAMGRGKNDDKQEKKEPKKPEVKPSTITEEQHELIKELINGDFDYYHRLSEFFRKRGLCKQGLRDLNADYFPELMRILNERKVKEENKQEVTSEIN